jgi:hypothetical protein
MLASMVCWFMLLSGAARQALAGIHDPRFKVQQYSEGSATISRSSQNGYFLTNLCTACESCCFCFRGWSHECIIYLWLFIGWRFGVWL